MKNYPYFRVTFLQKTIPKNEAFMLYKKLLAILGCLLLMPVTIVAQTAKTVCKLEIYNTEIGKRTVIKEFPYLIEAPNWTKDGKSLIYNSGGKMYKLNILNQEEEIINTDFAIHCNNDHVISNSGQWLAVSHHTVEDGKSRIYTLPITGEKPVLITPLAPSYLHGWSPDENTLIYCAERNGNFDVYTIPADGGEETRLTQEEGLDDGPEYSPDGKYIWFNSSRTGLMQIWRMEANGNNPEQMTFDTDKNSWFPHVSPNGQKVVYIAYKKDDVNPTDHPFGKDVELYLMSSEGGEKKSVIQLFGGQGTLNVNSWSPDSKRFAFVSYEREI